MKTVFEYQDYREFLKDALPISGEKRGLRSRLAEALGCRLAFISNVLNGLQHFSLEQGPLISEFLKLSPDEQEYFMLLLQHGRAGSKKLEVYFEAQMQKILREREKVRARLAEGASVLSDTDRAIYYSSWIPIALHVLCSIPSQRSAAKLARRLRLSESEIHESLDFLINAGILGGSASQLSRGPTRIHLDSSSPFIRKHHANWRLKAIEAIDRATLSPQGAAPRLEPLHYSLVMSLSEKDLQKIRKVLLEAIERTDQILKPSPEETGACLNIDLFEI